MQVQRVTKNVERQGDFEATLGNLKEGDLVEMVRSMSPLGNISPAVGDYYTQGNGYARLDHIEVQLSRGAEGSRVRVSPLKPNDRKDADDVQRAARLLNIDLYNGHRLVAIQAEVYRIGREIRRNFDDGFRNQESA